MKLNIECILLAGFGAIAPTMFKLANSFISNPTTPAPQFVYYVGIVIVYFFGACIARAFKETNTKKAFLLGLSLPGIISSAAPINSSSIKLSQVLNYNIGLVPCAFAGDKINNDHSENKSVNDQGTLEFYDKDGHLLTESDLYTVKTIRGANGQRLVIRGANGAPTIIRVKKPADEVFRKANFLFRSNLSVMPSKPAEIELITATGNNTFKTIGVFPVIPGSNINQFIPSNSTSVMLRSGNITAKLDVPVWGKKTTNFIVDLLYKPKNDFLWALGFQREMELVAIKLIQVSE
jgi:hypothetical protein